MGCHHVEQLWPWKDYANLIEEPQQAGVVARWNAEAERLLAEMTAGRTPEEQRALRDRMFAGHKAHVTAAPWSDGAAKP